MKKDPQHGSGLSPKHSTKQLNFPFVASGANETENTHTDSTVGPSSGGHSRATLRTIGIILRRLRRERGVEPEQIAYLTGIPIRRLLEIEDHIVGPSFGEVVSIVALMGGTISIGLVSG